MKVSLFILILSTTSATGMGWCSPMHWYRGCLHCHSNVSDGDSSPEKVVEWYRSRGYDFIALTDHNRFTDVDRAGLNRHNNFLVIGGEEVTMNCKNRPVHINGIGIRHLVKPIRAKSIEEMVAVTVLNIRKAGGIAQIDHPFYMGRFSEKELGVIGGFFLLEVHNTMVSTGPEHEMLLDRLTWMGKNVYGTAGDDAHYYKPRKNKYGTPGQGWIMLRAPSLTLENVMASLQNGDFYATSGITLSELTITDRDYRVRVIPEKDTIYTITFKAGELAYLQQTTGPGAVYRFSGREPYVRCRIDASTGKLALTQPYRIALKR